MLYKGKQIKLRGPQKLGFEYKEDVHFLVLSFLYLA